MCSATALGKKLLVDVNMQWKPTTELTAFKQLDYNDRSTLKIALKDARKVNPSARIGENKEKENDFKPVETKDNIAEFVNENMSEVLKEVGLKTVTENAEYVLTGEIKDYFVTETNTYQGVLKMNLVLQRNGKTVWDGVIIGKNSRFGRSYKLDNYMESLSDSIIDAAYKMLEDNGFKKAFQTKTGKN